MSCQFTELVYILDFRSKNLEQVQGRRKDLEVFTNTLTELNSLMCLSDNAINYKENLGTLKNLKTKMFLGKHFEKQRNM